MNFNEVTDKINAILNESVEDENEKAELKAKKRYYDAAVEALENLQNFLWDNAGPNATESSLGDEDLDKFNLLLNDAIAEIHSRGLAFEA